MGAFSGSEPLVGEIVGLRTFRVDESGLLLPLYSPTTWYDGANTALCAPPTGDAPSGEHPVPGDGCECGFYAYGSATAVRRYRQSRYVLAVVSCWGSVVGGTQGVRAEHARIVALWLNPHVPTWVRQRLASRYPSTRIYADRQQMLAEHPLTALPCYADAGPAHLSRRVPAVLAAASVLTLGALPVTLLRSVPVIWGTWLVTTVALGALAAWLLVGSRETGHRAAALVCAGVLAWLVAPVFGVPGWLLRVPLLRGFAVAAGGFLLTLRPGFFPVERSRHERAFCGVRS